MKLTSQQKNRLLELLTDRLQRVPKQNELDNVETDTGLILEMLVEEINFLKDDLRKKNIVL